MAKKKKQRKIPEVLVYTDINHYQDDLASMVVLAYLADKKLINLKGIITELGSYEIRRRRALYAKGALAELGYPFVRVVPGGDYEVKDPDMENSYPENEYSAIFENKGTAILRSGTTFVQEYIKSVKERNIVILLNAPFPDFVKYMKSTGETIQKKVKKIVVMGGAADQRTSNGLYRPNPECFNFQVGYPAAVDLFKYVQENNVRMILVPPQSVKDMGMNNEYLDCVAKSKNPVAQQLLKCRGDNPLSLQYDMLSALALSEGELRSGGGTLEKEEDCPAEVYFAKVENPELMHQKFCDIFKNKLLPKKITLEQLCMSKTENKNNASSTEAPALNTSNNNLGNVDSKKSPLGKLSLNQKESKNGQPV